MNRKDAISELVSELRNGKYVQGKSYLKRKHEGELFYCPLGIACEIYKRHNPETSRWHYTPKYKAFRLVVDDDYATADICIPQTKVTRFFGIPAGVRGNIMSLNDGGTSFSRIADYLELEITKGEIYD